VGRGRAVLYRTPTVDGPFLHEAMAILDAEADRAGVRRWCRADAQHSVNLMYAGRDKLSGRHLFICDFTRSVLREPPEAEVDFWTDRGFEFTFDPTLEGDAELVGLTSSFPACQGGEASFDPATHILRIRFRLPGVVKLSFGGVGAAPVDNN